ncbi:MAG: YggT family protein [Candidatus Omnitrophica bacterium]|jgi:YggT family protein|nr:YggT family protein [Candidatus Omnitrophota bacterium]
MFVMSNFLIALAQILNILFSALYWFILIRVLLSWVNPDPYNAIVQFLYKVTEPILYPIRKMLPSNWKIGIDLSPVIAVLLIIFFKDFLVRTLIDLAYRFK